MNILRAFAEAIPNAEWVDKKTPLPKDGIPVVRSRNKHVYRVCQECWDTNRPFIFVDTGYWLNLPKKRYHRFTIGHFQEWQVFNRPSDRWEEQKALGIDMLPWRDPGSKILLCPPTPKSIHPYDFTVDEWVENTIRELKSHTDREIIVRTKPPLNQRRGGNTIASVIAEGDIYAVVTFQSGSSVEAVMNGVPVIVDEHNTAAPVGRTNISQINDLYYPDRNAWVNNLAYSHFTSKEIASGLAWKILSQHPRWAQYK